jgi:AcrR family transcriptional regulator
MSTEKRNYELRVRRERQEATRRRIIDATEELHQEVGPAATTVADIARRAGVSRPTVYTHFPEETELFAACSAQFLSRHPPPDLDAALGLDDPVARVEEALTALYGWWRETEPMSGKIQRDRRLLPKLDSLVSGTSDAMLEGLSSALAAGFGEPSDPQVQAFIRLAVDFWTWSRLDQSGLEDRASAELMSRAIACVADTGS